MMSQKLGRPTQNNRTFHADFVDALGREYSLLSEKDSVAYEDTSKLYPMNFRLPRTVPVEARLPAPDIKEALRLAHPETKEIKAKGTVAEVWHRPRSNVGLIFLKDFLRFTDRNVQNSDDQHQQAN